MSILVRKINKAKWLQIDLSESDDVSADALTNCLKTNDNSLSVWEIESEEKINEAILAIASAGHHLESIDIIKLDKDYLASQNVEIKSSVGITKVEDLKDSHRDLANLTLSKMCIISSHIVAKFNKNDKEIRITKKTIKDLLLKAIKDERLDKSDLNDSIVEKL